MGAPDVDHLIVGGGIAGATCARTLRERGAPGSVLLLGRELDPPYHRPPASKGYLQGRESATDARVLPDDWWAAHAVTLRTGAGVLSLDPAGRRARLAGGEEISFGNALVATGAMVRRLNVEGSQLAGIHYLRSLRNADTIRADLEEAERVVLIGGSYIGCEVAASLTELGRRCTIVMLESVTLERAFGARAGAHFQGILESHGIEVIGPDALERFEGEDRVRAVITRSGRELPCDGVVVGAGAIPDLMLARRSGLEIGELGGVRADSRLQTPWEGIYVAGDMAQYDSVVHGRPMRIEHEEVAAAQGATAALNMTGAGVDHGTVPYFFSDLSDWVSLEYVGPALAWDQEVVRGSPADGAFSVWYLAGDAVAAVLSVGRPQDLEHGRRLVASRAAVAGRASQLADLGFDPGELG